MLSARTFKPLLLSLSVGLIGSLPCAYAQVDPTGLSPKVIPTLGTGYYPLQFMNEEGQVAYTYYLSDGGAGCAIYDPSIDGSVDSGVSTTSGCLVRGLNNSGQLIGTSRDSSSGNLLCFLSQGGQLDNSFESQISSLGSIRECIPRSISDSGVVVGTYRLSGDPNLHGFVYENGSLSAVPTSSLVSQLVPLSVQGNYVIAGNIDVYPEGEPDYTSTHAFIASSDVNSGSPTDLNFASADFDESVASSVNEAHQVLGSSYSIAGGDLQTATLWWPGNFALLPGLEGGGSIDVAMNGVGNIIVQDFSTNHYLMYSAATSGAYPNATYSTPSYLGDLTEMYNLSFRDMNDYGDLVGASITTAHGILVSQGVVYDLSNLLSGSGVDYIASFTGVSSSGYILAAGVDPDNNSRIVLFIPSPLEALLDDSGTADALGNIDIADDSSSQLTGSFGSTLVEKQIKPATTGLFLDHPELGYVDADGVLHALGAGPVRITASSSNQVVAKSFVVVPTS